MSLFIQVGELKLKYCKKCGIYKKLTEFYVRWNYKCARDWKCKDCARKYRNENYKKQKNKGS